MDILVVKKSFWRTKLFTAAIAEMVLIVLVYVLTELITGNKMFAIGMVAAFSIFSIYILGPIIDSAFFSYTTFWVYLFVLEMKLNSLFTLSNPVCFSFLGYDLF